MHENERKGLDTFRKKSQGRFERRVEKKRRRRDKTGSRLDGVDTGSLVHALAQPSPAPESSSGTSRYSETFIWCDMLVLWEE